MDDQEITDYLVKHLSDYADPDNLILELCQKTGRRWQEVEALLDQVRTEHQGEIAARQFPLLTLIAFGIFAGGVGLTVYSTYASVVSFQSNAEMLAKALDFDTALVRSLSEGASPLVEFLVGLFRTVYYVGVSPFFLLFVGISMILGSLLGMRDTWAEILDRQKTRRG